MHELVLPSASCVIVLSTGSTAACVIASLIVWHAFHIHTHSQDSQKQPVRHHVNPSNKPERCTALTVVQVQQKKTKADVMLCLMLSSIMDVLDSGLCAAER